MWLEKEGGGEGEWEGQEGWRKKKKKEPWHFFGTPLCPSCPERGGYHGTSGHLIKRTIVGALCVCARARECVCHIELHGNNLWAATALAPS